MLNYLDTDCVHVSAESDDRGLAGTNDSDDSRLREREVVSYAETVELFPDERARVVLLERSLRILMESPPHRHQPIGFSECRTQKSLRVRRPVGREVGIRRGEEEERRNTDGHRHREEKIGAATAIGHERENEGESALSADSQADHSHIFSSTIKI